MALRTVNHDDDEPSLTSLIERGEGYLRAETIGPLPFRRPPGWRKPWYDEHGPRPGISVIRARLSELVGR